MSETATPDTIHQIMVEIRRRVGTVDKTQKAEGADGKEFAYLGVKGIVSEARQHLDELGVFIQISIIPETYERTAIGGQGKWAEFQAVAVFNVVFIGPAGDTLTFTVPSAAVDDRDKFAPKLTTLALREALKAALLLFDGDDDIETNINPVRNGQRSAQPNQRGNNAGKGSMTEPMALKKERLRLQGILDRVGEETDETKLREVGETLELLDLFDTNDNLKQRLTKAEFTAAMSTLRNFGYLDPDPNMATKEDHKLVKGMLEHATKTDPDRKDDIRAAFKELDMFNSNGSLKAQLTKDQYKAAMRALADMGFDEPFGTDETPATKIEDMKAQLEDAPDGADIEAPIPPEKVELLDSVKAEDSKAEALAKATAAIDKVMSKPPAATKGDQQ